MSIKNQFDDSFLLRELDVSRETCDMLHEYYKILIDWNKKTNLVSRASVQNSWKRHFLDSAQLWLYAPKTIQKWLDFGSGGGFPGLVISIISQGFQMEQKIILVEKNKKKAAFLSLIAKRFNLKTYIYPTRVETLERQYADVITSRAFGNLKKLLDIANQHKTDKTICLFPKGKRFLEEIDRARQQYLFDLEFIENKLDCGSSILKIRNIEIGKG